MKPDKKINPLTQIELDAEQRAQEYKRKLIKKGMERLASEKQSEAVSPPRPDAIPPREDAPADSHDDRR